MPIRLTDLEPLLVARLGLEPIPEEGGWFRVTWRSAGAGCIVCVFGDGDDGFSAVHRLTVGELWFAHAGAPFELLLLHPDGSSEVVVLDGGVRPQAVVEPGTWMGGRPLGPWSLLSTVTVPAFTDGAFTLGRRDELVAAYPDRVVEITRLTRA